MTQSEPFSHFSNNVIYIVSSTNSIAPTQWKFAADAPDTRTVELVNRSDHLVDSRISSPTKSLCEVHTVSQTFAPKAFPLCCSQCVLSYYCHKYRRLFVIAIRRRSDAALQKRAVLLRAVTCFFGNLFINFFIISLFQSCSHCPEMSGVFRLDTFEWTTRLAAIIAELLDGVMRRVAHTGPSTVALRKAINRVLLKIIWSIAGFRMEANRSPARFLGRAGWWAKFRNTWSLKV